MKNLVKRSVSLLLCVAMLSTFVVLANAYGDDDYGWEDACFLVATTALRDYYGHIDLDMPFEMNEDMFAGASISEYISNKAATKRYIEQEGAPAKENYELSFNLISAEEASGYYKLTIQTVASFNYVNIDAQSGFGNIAEISFVSLGDGCQIADWYEPFDYYDTEIRQNHRFGSSRHRTADGIIAERQVEYLERLQEYFEDRNLELNDQDSQQISATTGITPFSLLSLNKTAIVNWARNNYNKSPPASGGGGVSYYDFSLISGNFDCTNFVSHALLAGGAPMNVSNTPGIQGTSFWYYTSNANRSESWAGVNQLHTFLTRASTTRGPVGTTASATFSAPPYNPESMYATYDQGDIMQFHNGVDRWRHSTIVTGYYRVGGSNSTTCGALVTGRTGVNSFNNNQTAETVWPGTDRRVIKLSGYRN